MGGLGGAEARPKMEGDGSKQPYQRPSLDDLDIDDEDDDMPSLE